MAFANERQWDLRDCSSLCNTCKQKEKRNGIFVHFLTLGWLPSFCLATNLGKCISVKGPLVSPKVTVHSATVNNSKNLASAKVNIFYSDIPSAWWRAMVPSYGGTSGTRALLGGRPRPIERRSSSWPFRVFGSICSIWSPCSSGYAWGVDGCSRCPWSAASASKSGSSTWSRPGCQGQYVSNL